MVHDLFSLFSIVVNECMRNNIFFAVCWRVVDFDLNSLSNLAISTDLLMRFK